MYRGLAVPAAKTLVRTTAAGTSYAVFLPSAAATVVAGETVKAVGLTVYYAGKTGIQVVAPTVEGGFLSALSLLSFGAVPVTYAAGGAACAVNQVAFTAAAPAAAAANAAATTGYHAGSYVGLVVYDAGTGATKVLIDQAESGVVLGYNALTALPAQTLMGAVSAVIFLAWDGPRLVIAAARGELRDPAGGKSHPLSGLPVGTVVDLRKLEKTEGVSVERLSADPAVVRSVLEKLPADARGPDAAR